MGAVDGVSSVAVSYSRTLDRPVGAKMANTVTFPCRRGIVDIDRIKYSIVRAYNRHAPISGWVNGSDTIQKLTSMRVHTTSDFE